MYYLHEIKLVFKGFRYMDTSLEKTWADKIKNSFLMTDHICRRQLLSLSLLDEYTKLVLVQCGFEYLNSIVFWSWILIRYSDGIRIPNYLVWFSNMLDQLSIVNIVMIYLFIYLFVANQKEHSNQMVREVSGSKQMWMVICFTNVTTFMFLCLVI